MTALPTLTHEDATELAGLYVLDALDAAGRRAMEAHLASCADTHAEIGELGGVVPALATMAEPLDAPAELKSRVLAAVQREAASTGATATQAKLWDVDDRAATAPVARRWSPPAWASWGSALMAVLVLAVVGVWGLGAQSAADRANARAQVLAEAVSAYTSAGSSTALLRGSGDKQGASGFAAFTAEGNGYLVMVGLPAAPAGQTYQAWYIDDAGPHSAGLLTVGADGYAVLVDDQPLTGAQVVALTVERIGGSALPTTDPFAAGEVRPPA